MIPMTTNQVFALIFGIAMVAAPAAAAPLKDPTRPPFYRPESTTSEPAEGLLPLSNADSWVLNSTLISKTQRLAMINGMLLSKGDKVGNMVVVDIKPDKALLRVNSESIEVTLVHNNIKTKKDDVNLVK